MKKHSGIMDLYRAPSKIRNMQAIFDKATNPFTNIQKMQNIFDNSRINAIKDSYEKNYAVFQSIPAIMSTLKTIEITPSVLANLTESERWLASIMPSIDVPLTRDFAFSYEELLEKEADQYTFEASMDIQEALADTQNCQQAICEVIAKWRHKNPVVAKLVEIILVTLFSIILTNIFNAITAKPTVIRDEPNVKASIIYSIPEDQMVSIVGEVPYYYEIQVIKPEGEETITGYVSKRSLKPLKSTIEKETPDH